MPDVNMPLELTNPSDGYQTRTATGKVYLVAPDAYSAFTKMVHDIATEFLAQRKYTVSPTVGYILACSNADGSETWTIPSAVVPPGLVGDPFVLSGIGTLTPQIQARFTGSNQVPFYSTHLATDVTRGIDAMGAYRGALGALDPLQANDPIRFITGLHPLNATDFQAGGGITWQMNSGATAINIIVTTATGGDFIVVADNDVLIQALNSQITLDSPTTNVTGNLDVDVDAVVNGELSVDGNSTIGASVSNTCAFNATITTDVKIGAVGNGYQIKEGTNAKAGVATLVAGTVTVATTAIAAGDRIMYARQAAGGTLGNLAIANIVAATSFDIVSDNAADTSDVYWQIWTPA